MIIILLLLQILIYISFSQEFSPPANIFKQNRNAESINKQINKKGFEFGDIKQSGQELYPPPSVFVEGKNAEIVNKAGQINNKDIKDIKQFGYDIFYRPVLSAPVPVGDEYILGPGDQIIIYLWGDPVDVLGLQSIYSIEVDREGKIFIPSLGNIYVWGKTVGEFREDLNNMLSKRFKNFRVDISIGKLRTFPVYIAGFVNKPGPVLAQGIDNILSVLIKAGGVSENGSLRNIIIKRKKGDTFTEIHIDLYDFLINGIPVDYKVKEGDIIYVPPVGKTVGITGAVKRPGIYELKEESTIADVINLAGGTTPDAYLESIKIKRYEGNIIKVYESSIDEIDAFKVKDGDLVIVNKITPEGIVEKIKVEGHVAYPGDFSLKENPTVSKILGKIKTLPDTDLNYAEIIRFEPPHYKPKVIVFSPIKVIKGEEDINLQNLDVIRFYPKWVYPPIEVTGEIKNPKIIKYYEGIDLMEALRSISFLYEIKELKADIFRNGNIMATVYLYDLFNKGVGNITLKPGDRIVIGLKEPTEKDKTVTILGEVKKPGIYRLRKGMTLYDALKLAGGYTEDAYPKGLVFIRESAKRLQQQHLQITLLTLRESLSRTREGISFMGGSEEEKLALQLALKRQRELLNLIEQKAKMGLGRIALDIPDTLEELKDSYSNIKLEDGDYIYVPPRPNYVLILGNVYNQISLPYIKDKTVREYLNDVGGPGEDADLDNIYIIKANGKVVSRKNHNSFKGFSWENRKLFIARDFMDITLDEGDTIVVPSKLSVPTMWRPLIKDVVQIIFQAMATAILAQRL